MLIPSPLWKPLEVSFFLYLPISLISMVRSCIDLNRSVTKLNPSTIVDFLFSTSSSYSSDVMKCPQADPNIMLWYHCNIPKWERQEYRTYAQFQIRIKHAKLKNSGIHQNIIHMSRNSWAISLCININVSTHCSKRNALKPQDDWNTLMKLSTGRYKLLFLGRRSMCESLLEC